MGNFNKVKGDPLTAGEWNSVGGEIERLDRRIDEISIEFPTSEEDKKKYLRGDKTWGNPQVPTMSVNPNVDIVPASEASVEIEEQTENDVKFKFSLPQGKEGKAYVPNVDNEGDLTWELEDNPSEIETPVNIKGPQGEQGIGLTASSSKTGKTTTVVVSTNEETPQEVDSFQINDGNNGHNPCLGRFPTSPSPMPTAQVGDYLYVDTTTTDALTEEEVTSTKVYHYGNDGWDEGTVIDAEHPTLASGQAVTSIHIKDVNGESDPDAQGVLSAEAGMRLGVKLDGVTAEMSSVEAENLVSNKYIRADNTAGNSNSYDYASFNVSGGKKVIFLGGLAKSEYPPQAGFCFTDAEDNLIAGYPYDNDNSLEASIEKRYVVDVPEGAVYLKTNVRISYLPAEDFYCYLQTGESVGDTVKEVNEIDKEIKGGDIVKSELHNYTEFTHQYEYTRTNNREALSSNYIAIKLSIPEGTQSIECIGYLTGSTYYGLAYLNESSVCIGGLSKKTGSYNVESGVIPISEIPTAAKYVSCLVSTTTLSAIRDYSCYVKFNIAKVELPLTDRIAFGSGQKVKDCHIINDLEAGGENDVLSAEQGKELNKQINGDYEYSEEVIGSTNFTSSDAWSRSSRNYGATGTAALKSKRILIPANTISIEGYAQTRNQYYYGIGFDNGSESLIGTFLGGYEETESISSNNRYFLIDNIPSGATYVAILVRDSSSNGQPFADCYIKFNKREKVASGLNDSIAEIPYIVKSLASNKRSDVYDKVRPMKVFFFANSFAVQTTQLLPNIFTSLGYDVTIGISYIGGGTLQQYYAKKDTSDTIQYVKYKGGQWVYPSTGSIVTRTIQQMLDDENWDVVFFIQGSAYAGLYSSYEPYFAELLSWLPKHIQSLGYKVGWFMPWAWTDAKISGEGGNQDGGTNNAEMYANICSATEDNMEEHSSDVDFLCPCGTAVENQLNYYSQAQVWVDGQHTNEEGYYAATLVLFDVLARYFCRQGVSNFAFTSESELGVSETLFNRAKTSALAAITNPYEMTVQQ